AAAVRAGRRAARTVHAWPSCGAASAGHGAAGWGNRRIGTQQRIWKDRPTVGRCDDGRLLIRDGGWAPGDPSPRRTVAVRMGTRVAVAVAAALCRSADQLEPFRLVLRHDRRERAHHGVLVAFARDRNQGAELARQERAAVAVAGDDANLLDRGLCQRFVGRDELLF